MAASKTTGKTSLSAQTVERGLDVLMAIVASPIGLTPAEAAKALKISRPAAYRAVAALERRGLIKRMAFSKRFVFARAALDALNARPVDDARLSAMHRIMSKLGHALIWPVVVAGPKELRMVVWATTDEQTSLTLERYGTGFDVPMLESASGHLYLAHLPAREQAVLIKRYAASGEPNGDLARDTAQISALLRNCKRNGYAMTTHEPLSRRAKRVAQRLSDAALGRTTSLAVPILHNGVAIACIAVRYFESAMPRAKAVQRYVPQLKAAAAEIAAAWQDDHNAG